MRERTIFFIAFILSVLLGILGYVFQQKPWDIINSILSLNCLVLLVQLYFHMKDGDPAFGRSIQEIKSHAQISALLAEFLSSISSALRRDDRFLNRQLLSFIMDARAIGRSLEAGMLEIDFRPGGLLFREIDISDFAEKRLRATSFVNPNVYWQGATGKQLLRNNTTRIRSGIDIHRIFIEREEECMKLAPVIIQNQRIGVRVGIVCSNDIDKELVRDFAIIDDGKIGVELFLENSCLSKQYFIPLQLKTGGEE